MSRFLSHIERKKRVVLPRPAPGAPSQPTGRYLMRVWYGPDLTSGLAWAKRNTFDGFISHLQYEDTAVATAVRNLIADGKLFWRYLIAQTYPYSRTEFGADKWSDYFRHNWQFNGSAAGATTKYRMLLTARTPDIVACFFGYLSRGTYGERYEMVPLQQFSNLELDALAAAHVSFARDLLQNGVMSPNAGVFCDNAYHEMRYWMIPNDDTYGSGHGNTSETAPFLKTAYETTSYQTDWNDLSDVHGKPSRTWRDYGTKFVYLTERIAELVAESGTMMGAPPWRIANVNASDPNGTNGHSMPWFFENIWSVQATNLRPAETSIAEWKLDKRNVLHHVCDGTPTSWTRVERHIDEWRQYGGWIEFTSDGTTNGDTQTEAAYDLAVTVRGQL